MKKTKTPKKQIQPVPVIETPQSELFKILMSDEHSSRLKALVQKINTRAQSPNDNSSAISNTVVNKPKRRSRAS